MADTWGKYGFGGPFAGGSIGNGLGGAGSQIGYGSGGGEDWASMLKRFQDQYGVGGAAVSPDMSRAGWLPGQTSDATTMDMANSQMGRPVVQTDSGWTTVPSGPTQPPGMYTEKPYQLPGGIQYGGPIGPVDTTPVQVPGGFGSGLGGVGSPLQAPVPQVGQPYNGGVYGGNIFSGQVKNIFDVPGQNTPIPAQNPMFGSIDSLMQNLKSKQVPNQSAIASTYTNKNGVWGLGQ